MRSAAPRVSRKTFVWLFVVGLVLQGGALWLRGTGDVLIYKQWALTALSRGVPNVYSLKPMADGNVLMPPDYPPLSVYILAGLTRVAKVFDPDLTVRSRSLTLFVKAPIILLSIAVVVALTVGVTRLTGDAGLARFVALAYWLNPALMLTGPALGYLDALCYIPGLWAIVAAANGWAGNAGTLAAIASLIKPQGLFFFLPVASALWRGRGAGLLRAFFNGGVVVVLTILPFLLLAPRGLIAGLRANFVDNVLSGDAMNLWWIVGAIGLLAQRGLAAIQSPLGTLPLSAFTTHAGFNPRPWAALAVIGVAAWAFWRVRGRRDIASHAAMCALVIHVYFVLAINVHENHLVYAIPLAALAALGDTRYWRLYAGLSVFVCLNLLLFYGLGRDFHGVPRVGAFWAVSVAGAFAGIALLAYHVRLFLRLADNRLALPR